MAFIAKPPTLTEKQKCFLNELASSRTVSAAYKMRAEIILLASTGCSNVEIAEKLQIHRTTAKRWRERWKENEEKLVIFDQNEIGINYKRALLKILSDEQRPGAPCKFTPEQLCQITEVACENPEELGYPLSHWSLPTLANELVKRGIVESISTTQLHVFLKSGSA